MGGGSHTKQDNVPKKPRSYSSDEATVSSGGATGNGTGGGGFDKEATGVCLISFKTKVDATQSVSVGAKFMLIPGADDKSLQLVSGGRQIGVYNGNRLKTLLGCIAGGYTYEGVVDSIDQTGSSRKIACSITGLGPI